MNTRPSPRGQTVPQVAVALGAIALVGVAFAALVSSPSGAAAPSASPSSPPIVVTPRPSAPATPAPSAPVEPSPSGVPAIELDSSSGHDVRADVIDQVGWLVRAESGTPGDGMSVRWHDAIVRQHRPNAIEVTWVALPVDDHIGLGIHALDGPLTVVIVQAGPVANSDAMGEDRVVILTFDRAVRAADVAVEVLDRSVDA